MEIIDKLLDSPSIVIVVSLFFLILLLYSGAINLNGAIGYIALIVGIATVLYTRKSMILGVRLQHTSDLRNFIQDWIDFIKARDENLIEKLPTLDAPFNEKHHYKPDYGLYELIHKGLYADLLNNHLPEGHERFLRDWNEYLKVSQRYEDSCLHLYWELSRTIEETLKKQIGIKLSDEFEIDKSVVNMNYVKLVYVEFIREIVDLDIYHPEGSLKPINLSISTQTLPNGEKLHRLKAQTKNGQEYYIANGTLKQMESVKRLFDLDIIAPSLFPKFTNQLKGYNVPIIESIKKGYQERYLHWPSCSRTLKELKNYIVLKGNNCYILKQI